MLIDRPTVFVFGAGASAPFGFPLGKGLVHRILSLRYGDDPLVTSLVDGHEFISFQGDLRDTDLPSIDRFLEHRPTYWKVGSISIAACLLPIEHRSNLGRRELSDNRDDAYGRWFGYFFEPLKAAVSADQFTKHKITLITLNYERSLEFMMHSGLMGAYGLCIADAAELLSHIPIIHLHGSFGPLPWQDRDGTKVLDYGEGFNHAEIEGRAKAIRRAASGIRIIYDNELAQSVAFSKAREAVSVAERIVFFGFGFDPITIDRLLVPRERGKVAMYATGFNVHQSTHDRLRHFYGGEKYFPGAPSERMHELIPRWMAEFCTGK